MDCIPPEKETPPPKNSHPPRETKRNSFPGLISALVDRGVLYCLAPLPGLRRPDGNLFLGKVTLRRAKREGKKEVLRLERGTTFFPLESEENLPNAELSFPPSQRVGPSSLCKPVAV